MTQSLSIEAQCIQHEIYPLSQTGSGDLTQWVNEARSGNREAFSKLHEQFAPMVHGMLLVRVPASDVDDLLQDVFLHALQKLRTLRNPDSFGPWLAKITRNMAKHFYRRRKKLSTLPDDIVHSSRDNKINEDAQSDGRRILDLIKSLPDSYAETLVLRLVEGLTGPQIAAYTGQTHGSIRVNLNRGMKLLQEKLSTEFPYKDNSEGIQ